MIEYNLIKVFLRKKEYETYYQYLSSVSNRELQRIIYSLKELHKAEKEEYTLDELELCFYGEYPALRGSEKDLYSILFKRIREAEADPVLIEQYLEKHRNSQLAHKTATMALEVYEGRKDISELYSLLSELSVPSPKEEEIECLSLSLRDLMEDEAATPGFEWRLKCLNQSIGHLRKGALGHIFARIEVGKTAMWVSELTYMVQQLEDDQCAIVFFNEEDGEGVAYRIYSSLLGKPYQEVIASPEESEREFLERGGGKIKFIDRPALSKQLIEKAIQKFKPSLVVIDNMDKVKGFDADRRDMELANIYKWGRELAKTYCPILSVGQADATAHNKRWVDESQMADGKTGKPSETDFTIGIGKTSEEGMSAIRHIYISRNKMRGGPETIPELRHGKFDVLIHPELSRYEDIDYG